jgi:type I restriction enzyme S subunit
MEEWKEYRLGDICTKIGSGATPKGGKEAYLGGDTSLIRSQNVQDFSFSCAGLAYINDEQAAQLSGVEIEKGDVLLNITGDSVARACIVPDSVLPARVNQHVSIIRGDKAKVQNDFILFFLQHNKRYLLSLSKGGATRNALTKKMIEELTISLPSLSKQVGIVRILKSLDDKIEVNRRINENLEAQAQALFKSWFVDFEPFKNGEFVESELGMIPKGWKIACINEILEISKQSINPSKFPHDMFAHYSIPAYDNNKYPEKQHGKEILSNKFIVRNKMSLFSKLNPRIKRIWYVNEVEENSICSTEFVPYLAKDSALSPFVYSLISSQRFYDYVMSLVNGATGSHQRFHPEESLSYQIAFNQESALRYSQVVEPMISQIMKNQQESRRLASLRDTLLPKLMSGEIEV